MIFLKGITSLTSKDVKMVKPISFDISIILTIAQSYFSIRLFFLQPDIFQDVSSSQKLPQKKGQVETLQYALAKQEMQQDQEDDKAGNLNQDTTTNQMSKDVEEKRGRTGFI